MNTATVHATIPAERDSIETAITNGVQENLRQNRVIFTVADTVSHREKITEPSTKGFGGVYRPELKTLKHNGNPGMIYRCKLTVMQEKMDAMNADMVPPGERKNWSKGYTQSNSKYNSETEAWEDLEVSGNGYLLFKARLPGNEVKRAVERTLPNGVGGIVEITALRGASRAEVAAAQNYYFPEWQDIQRGIKVLPVKISEIETHIKARLNAVQQEVEPAKIQQYITIGREMLQSCTAYREFGQDLMKYEEGALNKAKVEGSSYPYSPLAESLLEQLEMKRKDDLVSGEASATTELVKEMRADREGKSETERLRLENENLKLKLQLQSSPTDASVEIAVEAEPETEVRLCGQPTAIEGAVCERKLKDDEKSCWQHPLEESE